MRKLYTIAANLQGKISHFFGKRWIEKRERVHFSTCVIVIMHTSFNLMQCMVAVFFIVVLSRCRNIPSDFCQKSQINLFAAKPSNWYQDQSGFSCCVFFCVIINSVLFCVELVFQCGFLSFFRCLRSFFVCATKISPLWSIDRPKLSNKDRIKFILSGAFDAKSNSHKKGNC